MHLNCEDQCFSKGKEIQWRNLDSLCELDYPLPLHSFMTDTGVSMSVHTCVHLCVCVCVFHDK